MKPEIKYEAGVVTASVKLAHAVDADQDGKPSLAVSADVNVQLDAIEVISEIAKKDYPLVEAILKSIKV